jgi:predicted DNA-binding protein (MmcQ/YjbR family)
VDIPFPKKIRNELVEKGDAEAHHVLPKSGWISIYLRTNDDVNKAINLLKRSYGLALEQMKKRNQKT